MIIPSAPSDTAASSSSCSFSSHSTIDTTTKDTQKSTTSKSKQELWHIIERQRVIIKELQKALIDVSNDRDALLLKNKSIPTPPPRSPYRSNNHGGASDDYTPKPKLIPPIIQNNNNNNRVKIKVKSIHSNRFNIAIIDHSGKESWNVEKTYTDLIHLNHTVKYNLLPIMNSVQLTCKTKQKLHKKLQFLFNLSIDLVDKKQRKNMIEEFFKNVLKYRGDLSNVYSFISAGTSKNQQGYLSKRGKHVIGSWKSYYFILCESELRYFDVKYKKKGTFCIMLY